MDREKSRQLWTLDASGAVTTSVELQGIRIEDLERAADGSLYAAGSFGGMVTVGGMPLMSVDFASDGILIKLTAAGVVEWVTTTGAMLLDTLRGVSVADDGRVYVTGSVQAGATMTSVDGNDQVTANADLASLLAVYDADGNLASVFASDGTQTEDGWPISMGGAGVVVGGSASVVSGHHVL